MSAAPKLDSPRISVVHRLEIPGWHPTRLNAYVGKHWSKGHKLKKADAAIIFGYARLRRIPEATAKRRVTLTIILAPRERSPDPDAFTKSLNDALVHAGLLVNDSPRWVENAPVRYERGQAKGAVIELEDIEP